MKMLYVSTSRKPTQNTRILAKWLARLLDGEYENRGKRSVSDIAARMEEKSFARAVFVYEKHGSPHSLEFFDLQEGWLSPVVLIGGFTAESEKRVPVVTSFEAVDSEGRKILGLGGFENSEVEDGLKLVASAKEIGFYDGKNKVFSITVKGFANEGTAGN
ncbi:MAG: hypothetical protein V1717_03025 [Candidatus Micrarchaeota archaeon]